MLDQKTKDNLQKFVRAANYLAVVQMFLKDNYLLKQPLEFEHIKPRILGHWGSCPGISVAYAHFLRLLKDHPEQQNNIFILGPGHGFPGLQADLFLEGALAEVDSQATRDEAGIGYICKQFSWPYGFPSHASPYSPGVISEGGELGYSLATAFGAVLDQPDMLVACLVGDGEAETGALSGAWHLNKLVASPENGFVLPILHLNGYKITGPTVFGRMSDKELFDYFSGLRYEPHIVDYNSPNDDAKLAAVFDQVYAKIEQIKAGEAKDQRLPMIVLKSPKGMTGPEKFKGKKLVGNNLSHQVIFDHAMDDQQHLQELEKWLRSYRLEELMAGDKFGDWLEEFLPPTRSRPGNNQMALTKKLDGSSIDKLSLPKVADFEQRLNRVGEVKSLPLHLMGDYLEQVFKLNHEKHNFRFFSPDETTSNKLGAIYNQTTKAWAAEIKSWDGPSGRDGKSMEILSEQSLQGMMQGYQITGRHGVLTSYEAFAAVINSMLIQYAKFIQQSRDVTWRDPIPAPVYLLTSTGWRQDHNGFSHQTSSFVDEVLRRQNNLGTVLFPADDNSGVVALDWGLRQKDQIVAIVSGKTEEPRWRSLLEAQVDFEQAASIWEFASDDQPDLVFAAVGDYMARESLYAMQLLRQVIPKIKMRFVYVSALTSGAIGTTDNQLSIEKFDQIFTPNQPIIFNFHGYPESLKAILFNYLTTDRASVHGYIEQGSTTTPFDMMVRNQASRYHLMFDALAKLAEKGKITAQQQISLTAKIQQKLDANTKHIQKYGKDLSEITDQVWQ